MNAGSDFYWQSEGRIPLGTKSLLNIYQSITLPLQDSLLELHGTRIENTESVDLEFVEQKDLDALGIQQTHGTIDEYAVPLIYEYILRALTFRKL